jgi:AAA domain
MAKVTRKVAPGKAKVKPDAPAADTPLVLPTARSVPSNRFFDYSWLCFGEKKIGKTTLWSNVEKAMFLMTEPGGRALSIYQVPIRNWKEFTGYVQLLERDKFYELVVVDTIDLAFKMAEKRALQRLGIDDPSE